MPKVNQKGVAHFLPIIAVVGLLAFLLISNTFSFRDTLFNTLFPKPKSDASLINKKVLLVVYNPTMPSGKKLIEDKNWNSPDTITQSFINDLIEVSSSNAIYTVAERIELDKIPVKGDGFQYTTATYLECINTGVGCHNPDIANYQQIIQETDACTKLNSGQIDELWVWGGPWFGFYESNLAGPNAFWYNSPQTTGTTCQKLLPIMGFNYQLGVEFMFHDLGHRVESTMAKIYRAWQPEPTNPWNKFSLLEREKPGQGGCGNTHRAFNARPTSDYDYDSSFEFSSSCDLFLNYPDLSGSPTKISCTVWGCNHYGYQKWFFAHLPKAEGSTDGVLNNWWKYLINPELAVTANYEEPFVTVSTEELNRGLVSLWHMDEASGSSIINSIPNSPAGNVTGATVGVGVLGKGRVFRASDYIQIPNSFQVPSQNGSLSVWVKSTTWPAAGFDLISAGVPFNDFKLIVANSGRQGILGFFIGSTNARTGFGSSGGLPLNKWSNLILTWNNQGVKAYIDGRLVDSTRVAPLVFNQQGLKVGGAGFVGEIDELGFWDRSLSRDEVLTLHNKVLEKNLTLSSNGNNSVAINWRGNTSPDVNDSLNLYIKNAPPQGWIAKIYTSCTNLPTQSKEAGECTFTSYDFLPDGEYEFRFIKGDDYTKPIFSKSTTFNIRSGTFVIPIAPSPSPTPSFVPSPSASHVPSPIASPVVTPTPLPSPTSSSNSGVTVSSSQVTAGQTVIVTWSNLTHLDFNDWMGLFPIGDPNNLLTPRLFLGSCSFNTGPVSRAFGSCPFTIPGNTASGDYIIKIVSSNPILTSNPIRVVSPNQ